MTGREEPPPIDVDVAVVGAGIAGLTAAWQLRTHRVLLLEAGPRPGGRILSEPRGEYWLNLGPHLFPGPESALGRLVTDVGLETVQVPGTGLGLWFRGKLVSSGPVATYPARLPLRTDARLSLFRSGHRIQRAVKAYRALGRPGNGEPPGGPRRRLLAFDDNRPFSAFLGPIAPEVDVILRAAIRRVSAEPEELAAGAGVAQFATTFSQPATSLHRNLPGGASELVKALTDRLGPMVRCSSPVTEIRDLGDHVTVEWSDPGGSHLVKAACAIVATPAPVTRRIVPELPSGTSLALEGIRYGPYVVAGMLTTERRPMAWDHLYAMVAAERSFNMFFNVASVLRTNPVRQPGGSLMVYGASDLARHLLDRSDGEVIDLFLQDLGQIFPGLRPLVTEVVVQRWEAGIPFSVPGRHLSQDALERDLGRLVLAGDYLGERGGMDTAAASAVEAAARVMAFLPGSKGARSSGAGRAGTGGSSRGVPVPGADGPTE